MDNCPVNTTILSICNHCDLCKNSTVMYCSCDFSLIYDNENTVTQVCAQGFHNDDKCKCNSPCVPNGCSNGSALIECNDNTCDWFHKCGNRRIKYGLCQPLCSMFACTCHVCADDIES
eukprot:215606_1